MSMKEIDRNHQEIGQLDHMIRSNTGDYKFSFDVNLDLTTLQVSDNIAGVARLRFHLFGLYLTLIVSVCGGLTIAPDGRHEIYSNQHHIHHKWFSDKCFASDEDINKYVYEVVTYFEVQDIPVVRYQPED